MTRLAGDDGLRRAHRIGQRRGGGGAHRRPRRDGAAVGRKHAVDLDAIGGAFSTGVAWPQLDESSRALWTSLGWDAKSWARGPSPPTEDLEWKQLGDGERAAAEARLGYSEATWNDMKKWSFAFLEAAAEEAKAERIDLRARGEGLARQNGVRAGDVLVAVNGQKVGDHEEARDLVAADGGARVRLELSRYDVGPPLDSRCSTGLASPRRRRPRCARSSREYWRKARLRTIISMIHTSRRAHYALTRAAPRPPPARSRCRRGRTSR